MRLYGNVAMWLCGYVAVWLCGYVPMWLFAYFEIVSVPFRDHFGTIPGSFWDRFKIIGCYFANISGPFYDNFGIVWSIVEIIL